MLRNQATLSHTRVIICYYPRIRACMIPVIHLPRAGHGVTRVIDAPTTRCAAVRHRYRKG